MILIAITQATGEHSLIEVECEARAQQVVAKNIDAGNQAFYRHEPDDFPLYFYRTEYLMVDHNTKSYFLDKSKEEIRQCWLTKKYAVLARLTDTEICQMSKYSMAEKHAFNQQKTEAHAYLVDSSTPTPAIDTLGAYSDKTQYCKSIVQQRNPDFPYILATQKVRKWLRAQPTEVLIALSEEEVRAQLRRCIATAL